MKTGAMGPPFAFMRGPVLARGAVSPDAKLQVPSAHALALVSEFWVSRVDRAAVAHVKRASPFPKPPAGAQTRFVIPIEFRR